MWFHSTLRSNLIKATAPALRGEGIRHWRALGKSKSLTGPLRA